MAVHNWPAGLPCFALSGYSGQGDDGIIRSEFPAGMKVRPRFTKAPPEQVRAIVYCTAAQLQTVLDFWEVTLKRVLAFNYRDVTKPADLTTVEYRFLARPTYSPMGSGRKWRVELQLEKLSTFQGTFPVSGNGSLLDDGSGNTITT